MIKSRLEKILASCFEQGRREGRWTGAAAGRFGLERPKHDGQGDLASNMAMVIAGLEKKKPREVAAVLVAMLGDAGGLAARLEIAGPGFINFFIRDAAWQDILPDVISEGAAYGRSQGGKGRRVLVEFVSANPTGPLSVGHGRQAALGDAIARLLAATGHEVTREYYYNNAGRQMRVLGQSTQARYRELLGLPAVFPEDGYQGEYIWDIARKMVAEHGDALADCGDAARFTQAAEKEIMADIGATLDRMGIRFDSYYNEQSLYDNGYVDEVVAELRARGLVYEHEGAVWFRSTELGLEQDRVIVKKTGEATYRLPDIAYHREKFRRGFDWMVDIFGADHIATVPDVLAGIRALGLDEKRVTTVIHQFVTLVREGRQVKMSTRKATFVTVDQLMDEAGVDAVRFFFLMRKADSQLEFDVELASRQSQENPVYYVQYAHARLCSILKQAAAQGILQSDVGEVRTGMLAAAEEIDLLQQIAAFPRLVEEAALGLAPHRLVFFLVECAGKFHSFYNKHKVLGNDQDLTQARLLLVSALRLVFAGGLGILGIRAPESM